MKKAWEWFKPKIVWIASGAATIVGLVVMFIAMGRRRRKIGGGAVPTRPNLKVVKNVEIPTVRTDLDTDFNDKPADDFAKAKTAPSDDKAKVIKDLNRDFQ